MKPLLFLGSRRSGTVLMNRAINSHPQMYSSFERYVVWLLYQCMMERNTKLGPYLEDTRKMEITLRNAGDVFERLVQGRVARDDLREAFFDASLLNMRSRPDGKNKSVTWIGEKNPETADFLEFANWLLPDAKYIHMVRHPIEVAFSKQRFIKERYMLDPSWAAPIKEQVRKWLRREERIQDAIASGIPIITVRLEDVWSSPEHEFNRVFDFFGVDPSNEWRIGEWLKSFGYSYDTNIDVSQNGLREMMERYGYE